MKEIQIGFVRKFDSKKNFGFIRTNNKRDIFFHISNAHENNFNVGDIVGFYNKKSDKYINKIEAVEVRLAQNYTSEFKAAKDTKFSTNMWGLVRKGNMKLFWEPIIIELKGMDVLLNQIDEHVELTNIDYLISLYKITVIKGGRFKAGENETGWVNIENIWLPEGKKWSIPEAYKNDFYIQELLPFFCKSIFNANEFSSWEVIVDEFLQENDNLTKLKKESTKIEKEILQKAKQLYDKSQHKIILKKILEDKIKIIKEKHEAEINQILNNWDYDIINSMSKKADILKYFSEMNIDKLVLILDNSNTYQNSTKDIFLQKLEISFNEFRNKKDSFLIAHEGKCCETECENNGCKGYSFVGNNSQSHLDLVFKESDENFKDIYQCSGFEIEDKNVVTNEYISLKINKDEEASFKPSIEFQIESQNCENACHEILKNQNSILLKDEYLNWLEKHRELYKYFELPPIFDDELDEFHSLYKGLKSLSNYAKYNNEAKNAINDFNASNYKNEEFILQWLVKYEDLGNNLILFTYNYFEEEKEFIAGYVELPGKFKLKVEIDDFYYLIPFKKIFDDYYWSMLEKYKSVDGKEETENNTSLTFYLKRKGN